ncbi:MAG: hypothetical protein H6621_13305 [Halobacteriovoraceae bacterium]|nr:hypothetical protein [Halobacteriovoraceae bacterium]
MKKIGLLLVGTLIFACGKKEKVIIKEPAVSANTLENENSSEGENSWSISTDDRTFDSDNEVSDDFLNEYNGTYALRSLFEDKKSEIGYLNINLNTAYFEMAKDLEGSVDDKGLVEILCRVKIGGYITSVVAEESNKKTLAGEEMNFYLLQIDVDYRGISNYFNKTAEIERKCNNMANQYYLRSGGIRETMSKVYDVVLGVDKEGVIHWNGNVFKPASRI